MANYVKTPLACCLECGRPLNAIGTPDGSSIEGPAAPEPGALLVCIGCGAVMAVGDDLRPRGMTDTEMDAVLSDAETMDALARLVSRVHAVRAIV